MTTKPPDPAVRQPRSAVVATALSFLWPGLGQWYARRPRAAALYAIPIAVPVVILVIRALGGIQSLAIQLIDPSVALTVLVLVVVIGIWRVLAMVDASAAVNRRTVFTGRPGQALAILGALVLATHGVFAYYAWSFYENGSQIFVGDGPDPTPGPSASAAATDDFQATPFATPATPEDRITILLTGIDKNTERTESLTDTLLVASINPKTGDVALVSFPRDLSELPLYNGGTYHGKINSLMTYASRHADTFPDGPLTTLTKELGFLLGIPIHYYAAIDLDGFQRMIDQVGGVTVTLDRPLNDARYSWLDGTYGLFLPKGEQTLDGRTALAYVRSRFGAGDNDFTRAARQQTLLLALRRKLTDPSILPRLPAILDAAGDTIRTSFPPDRIDEMLALGQSLDESAIQRFVLQPPVFSVHPPTNTTGGIYTLRIHEDAVRRLSVRIFGEDSAFWTGEFDLAGSPIPATPAP